MSKIALVYYVWEAFTALQKKICSAAQHSPSQITFSINWTEFVHFFVGISSNLNMHWNIIIISRSFKPLF